MDASVVSFPRRRLVDREDDEASESRSFALPSVADPAAFAERHFNVYKGDQDGELRMKFAKGTTVSDQMGRVLLVSRRHTYSDNPAMFSDTGL
jgi:hypothetical protein